MILNFRKQLSLQLGALQPERSVLLVLLVGDILQQMGNSAQILLNRCHLGRLVLEQISSHLLTQRFLVYFGRCGDGFHLLL